MIAGAIDLALKIMKYWPKCKAIGFEILLKIDQFSKNLIAGAIDLALKIMKYWPKCKAIGFEILLKIHQFNKI